MLGIEMMVNKQQQEWIMDDDGFPYFLVGKIAFAVGMGLVLGAGVVVGGAKALTSAASVVKPRKKIEKEEVAPVLSDDSE